MGQE
jgi:hypothetical protein